MFTKDMRDAIDENTPKLNPLIANGLVTEHIKRGEAYVNSVWRVAEESFPPGLKYVGQRRLTPMEEFEQLTRKRNSSPRQYDVAPSDLYFMEFNFTYNNQPLDPVYMRLPYVGDGGTMRISGSRYVISPVLADRVISIGRNSIFVRLLQIKLTFNRESYYYSTNDPSLSREIVQIVWAKIWNGAVEKLPRDDRVEANTTVAHYMFAKYGATETFMKFAGANPIFGTEETVNEALFPQDEWIICSSAEIQQRSNKNRINIRSELKVAVLKTEYTAMTKSLIAGLFYVIDNFTYRRNYLEVDNVNSWRIMLGILIFGKGRNEGALLSDINEHISSMDNYMDGIVVHLMARIGYECNDIYQLFSLILNRIDSWILDGDMRGNSKYDKELSILYTLYFDITSSIFRFYFELKKLQKKNSDLTAKKIQEVMKTIKAGAIFALKNSHGEVSSDDFVGDNKALKTTLMVVPQSKTTKAPKQGDHVSLSDPSNQFHASFAEVQVLTAMTKASPSGETRLSPYLNLDDSGLILRNEPLRDLIDHAQMVVSRNQ
jgi:hypothetical protein